MTKTQELKQPIRQWLALFPEQRLVDLLAHAQDGKLLYASCCCIAGAINAPHALRGAFGENPNPNCDHTLESYRLHQGLGKLAEIAFCEFGFGPSPGDSNARRRRVLIPMIRSEMWQRERRKSTVQHHPVLSLTISPMEVVAEQELLNVPTAL